MSHRTCVVFRLTLNTIKREIEKNKIWVHIVEFKLRDSPQCGSQLNIETHLHFKHILVYSPLTNCHGL